MFAYHQACKPRSYTYSKLSLGQLTIWLNDKLAFGTGNRMIDNPKVPRRVFNNPSAQNCCNDLMNVDYGQTSVWWHHYILGTTSVVLMVCTNLIIQHDGIKTWSGLWAPPKSDGYNTDNVR